jgi:hypothetical protein
MTKKKTTMTSTRNGKTTMTANIKPRPLICAWRTGSTNKDTGKSEMPQPCQAIGCPGEFARMPPMIDGNPLDCFTFPDGTTWEERKPKR